MLDLRCKLLLLTAFVGPRGCGQILVCVAGRGYYQEWGKPAQELRPGDAVNIPVGVKHWHGAAPESWFSHLAVEVPGDEPSNEWLEAVDNTAYFRATEWLEHLEISEK